MSITPSTPSTPSIPSIPVLIGDHGVELRVDVGGLLLSGPREEVRIPLGAVARVAVAGDGRSVTVELTAPAGAEPAVYRIEGVSRASATLFEGAVNGALPERPAGEDPVDGSTLVTITPKADEGAGRETRTAVPEEEAEPRPPADRAPLWGAAALGLGVVALSAGVVAAGEHVSRAIVVFLLGGLTLLPAALTIYGATGLWDAWYLPRHGVTVATFPTLFRGRVTYGYVSSDGKVRGASGPDDVVYHPKYPAHCMRRKGVGETVRWSLAMVTVGAILTALLAWATLGLAFP
ncbi:hypothetical protein AB0G79_25960 [Streptomyces sp. NPDC020807]|uniref:hypothetical protein n=1 Tax=Streptomyces sp. NPDC020807 TaxID=3155119 RepID=UPI0033F83925